MYTIQLMMYAEMYTLAVYRNDLDMCMCVCVCVLLDQFLLQQSKASISWPTTQTTARSTQPSHMETQPIAANNLIAIFVSGLRKHGKIQIHRSNYVHSLDLCLAEQ